MSSSSASASTSRSNKILLLDTPSLGGQNTTSKRPSSSTLSDHGVSTRVSTSIAMAGPNTNTNTNINTSNNNNNRQMTSSSSVNSAAIAPASSSTSDYSNNNNSNKSKDISLPRISKIMSNRDRGRPLLPGENFEIDPSNVDAKTLSTKKLPDDGILYPPGWEDHDDMPDKDSSKKKSLATKKVSSGLAGIPIVKNLMAGAAKKVQKSNSHTAEVVRIEDLDEDTLRRRYYATFIFVTSIHQGIFQIGRIRKGFS